MPTKKRRPNRETASPLVRAPAAKTKDAADALMAELQELYKGTRALHWPDELRDGLRYARRHRKEIADPGARKREAVIRVELWEYVREQDKRETDREQSRAVEDATEAGVSLTELAGPLRVSGRSGVRQKYLRQLAPTLRDEAGRPLRRTPEAVLAALKAEADAQAAAEREQIREDRRHSYIAQAAVKLREHQELLNLNEFGEYFLEQTDIVLEGCLCVEGRAAAQLCTLSPLRRASLAKYLLAAVSHLKRAGQPDTLPEQAAAAWAQACEIAEDSSVRL